MIKHLLYPGTGQYIYRKYVIMVVFDLFAVGDLDGQKDFLWFHNCLPVTGEESVVHLNHPSAV